MDKIATAILAAIVVLGPMGYIVYSYSDSSNDEVEEIVEGEEEIVDHSKHLHEPPELEALLVEFEGDQFISGNVIHDHPMEVRIEVSIISAEGEDSDLISTDMEGAWDFEIEIEDRSENITITFRAHNLPEDTWSENLTFIIEADEVIDEDNNDEEDNNNNTDNDNNNNSGDSNNQTNSENSTNNPPVCDIGIDSTVEVGQVVVLDASNSADSDGDNLENPLWTFVDKPEDSNSEITNPSNIIAEFNPDVIGNYTIQFYVDDGTDYCKSNVTYTSIISPPEISPTSISQEIYKDNPMDEITFLSLGGSITSWEIVGSLPDGIIFDTNSGKLSGIPTENMDETDFVIYANNSAGSVNAIVTLSVIESGYDPTDLAQFWLDFFFCQTTDDSPIVDDLTTSGEETLQCEITITLNETHLLINTNGIPNHDFESTLACSQGGDCTSEKDYTWSIPRNPTNDTTGNHDSTNCPEANGDYACAPDRGSIAIALNGVPLYGPEDGPGGDAVSAEHGAYNEDRQPIELGVCHGHAAQGGTYHYHADANCMHWHPDEGENIKDDYDDSAPNKVAPNTYDGNHSKVIGVAFDGYPIYGFWGYDDQMNVVEMKSSYELKEGETGYNGIDDYKYTEGLGHLDVCNGHFGPTPDFPQGIYHYHSTMQNGDGDMGFPYFLICYHGEVPEDSRGEDPCAGYGETWGPGIGPPPPGCGGGSGQQAFGEEISYILYEPFVIGIVLLGLMLSLRFRRR
ncbi:MAG: YHYH protein [Candidatus Poseidoniaceae archaeon]|jgi:hypothetical protein|nr:YHYH protein [Candidatus Poseidoniaceae archaeon]